MSLKVSGSYTPPRAGIKVKLVVAVIGACLVCWLVASTSGIPTTVQTVSYTVRSGDTVWSIAKQDHRWPTDELRDWIDSHNNINGDGTVQPGQVLVIPANGS